MAIDKRQIISAGIRVKERQIERAIKRVLEKALDEEKTSLDLPGTNSIIEDLQKLTSEYEELKAFERKENALRDLTNEEEGEHICKPDFTTDDIPF